MSFRLRGARRYNINIGLCVLLFQSALSIHLAQRVRFMDWGTLQEIDWIPGIIKGNKRTLIKSTHNFFKDNICVKIANASNEKLKQISRTIGYVVQQFVNEHKQK